MTFRFGAATTLSLTTLLVVACGGQVVSIGGESTSQSLTPSTVTVATTSCPTGYEHTNICCTGGDKKTTPTCEAWPNDPFHPCDPGFTLYPNAASCCSLDNPADCLTCTQDNATAPSAGPNGTVTSGTPSTNACSPTPDSTPPLLDGGVTTGGGTCESRCPPGYTGISPYDPAGCCQYDANGTGTCFGEAAADDAGVGPILLADGGIYDGGVADASVDDGGAVVDASPPPGYDASVGDGTGSGGGSTSGGVGGSSGGGVSACAFTCPDGWFVSDPTLGVCCNNTKDGAEECFAAVFPDDNGGAGATGLGSGTSGSSGGSGVVDAGVPSH